MATMCTWTTFTAVLPSSKIFDSTNRTEDDAQGVPHSTGEGAVVGDYTGGRAVPWTSLQSESTFIQIDRTPHFPAKVAQTSSGRRSQPDCVVCSLKKGKRKTTTFMCKQCDLPMCPVPCFELYHTKSHPERYI